MHSPLERKGAKIEILIAKWSSSQNSGAILLKINLLEIFSKKLLKKFGECEKVPTFASAKRERDVPRGAPNLRKSDL